MPEGDVTTSDGGAPGPPDGRVGGAENYDDREAEGGGHVGRPGIVADEERCRGQQMLDFRERRAGDDAELTEGAPGRPRRRR